MFLVPEHRKIEFVTLQGFLLIVVSALLHAYWNLLARRIRGNVAAILLGLWVACAGTIPLLLFNFDSADFSSTNMAYSAVTGFLVGIYVLLLSGAYGVEELTFVYPISRGVGVFGTAILANRLFNESLHSTAIVGLALVLLGTIAIGLDHNQRAWRKGLTLSVLSGVALVTVYVLGKFMVRSMGPLPYCFSLYLACAITMTPAVLFRHKKELKEVLSHHKTTSVLIGVAAFLSYLFVLYAFVLDSAGSLIAVRELSVAFAALGGWLILKEPLTPKKVIGATTILFGSLLLKGL